jgi:uncharacterized membrane protein YfbV (UPF0208 family)
MSSWNRNIFALVFEVLNIKLRTLHILGKLSMTKLHPQARNRYFKYNTRINEEYLNEGSMFSVRIINVR